MAVIFVNFHLPVAGSKVQAGEIFVAGAHLVEELAQVRSVEGVGICKYPVQRAFEIGDHACRLIRLRYYEERAVEAARIWAGLDNAIVEHFLYFSVNGVAEVGRNLVLFPSSRLAICGDSYRFVELAQFVVGAAEDVSKLDTKLCEFMKFAFVQVLFGQLELLSRFQEIEEFRRGGVGAWRRGLKLHRRSFGSVGS